MKQLVLIRHAKSSWKDRNAIDFERRLNKRGKRDAPAMAKKLALRLERPVDLIVSSPAKRAKKTARAMAAGSGYDEGGIVYLEQIYDGSAATLLDIVKNLDDSRQTVFLVGHNFALTDFAEKLCARAIGNIPTCGVVALQFALSSWDGVEPGAAGMLFFDYPKLHPELQ